jgi:AcrR family transcriptional regulator
MFKPDTLKKIIEGLDFLYTDRYTIFVDNRTAILNKAIVLFSEKSYESVGVKQIAVEAEISKPTLYYYFGSKEGLMKTILEEHIAPFLSGVSRCMVYSGDVMKVLKQTARYYASFAEKSEHLYRLFKSMSAASQTSNSYRLAESFVLRELSLFNELFHEIAADHGNIREKYIVYAETFKSTVETYVRLKLTHFAFRKEQGLLHTIIHQFLHGIYS